MEKVRFDTFISQKFKINGDALRELLKSVMSNNCLRVFVNALNESVDLINDSYKKGETRYDEPEQTNLSPIVLSTSYKSYINYVQHLSMEAKKILPTYVALVKKTENESVTVVHSPQEVTILKNEEPVSVEEIVDTLKEDAKKGNVELTVQKNETVSWVSQVTEVPYSNITKEVSGIGLCGTNVTVNDIDVNLTNIRSYTQNIEFVKNHYSSYTSKDIGLKFYTQQKRFVSVQLPHLLKDFLSSTSMLTNGDIANVIFKKHNVYTYKRNTSASEAKMFFMKWLLSDSDKDEYPSIQLNEAWIKDIIDSNYISYLEPYLFVYVGASYSWYLSPDPNYDKSQKSRYTKDSIQVLLQSIKKFGIMLSMLIRRKQDYETYYKGLRHVFRNNPLNSRTFALNYEIWTGTYEVHDLICTPNKVYSGVSTFIPDLSGLSNEQLEYGVSTVTDSLDDVPEIKKYVSTNNDDDRSVNSKLSSLVKGNTIKKALTVDEIDFSDMTDIMSSTLNDILPDDDDYVYQDDTNT